MGAAMRSPRFAGGVRSFLQGRTYPVRLGCAPHPKPPHLRRYFRHPTLFGAYSCVRAHRVLCVASYRWQGRISRATPPHAGASGSHSLRPILHNQRVRELNSPCGLARPLAQPLLTLHVERLSSLWNVDLPGLTPTPQGAVIPRSQSLVGLDAFAQDSDPRVPAASQCGSTLSDVLETRTPPNPAA